MTTILLMENYYFWEPNEKREGKLTPSEAAPASGGLSTSIARMFPNALQVRYNSPTSQLWGSGFYL